MMSGQMTDGGVVTSNKAVAGEEEEVCGLLAKHNMSAARVVITKQDTVVKMVYTK